MLTKYKFVAAALIAGALATSAQATETNRGVMVYEVTITNLTPGQNLAPPSMLTHNRDYVAFTLGGKATPGLAELAETPSGAAFLAEAAAQPSVYDTSISSTVVRPGTSQTLTIESTAQFPLLTVATMVATTTDVFMAARDIKLPRGVGEVVVEADAYDAGTEAQTGTCEFVFGPPCNDLGHNPAEPEGFIHVSNGIHGGGGGLDPVIHTWLNPVAQISVKRVK